MGQNKTMPTPEAYPAGFHLTTRNGGGVLYADDLPWTTLSTAKRFRLFLALLRRLPEHPLHKQAKRRWRVEVKAHALVISVAPVAAVPALVGPALIESALARAAADDENKGED